ncbi:MAG: glycosyltransferase family 39 protein [Candidatus Woesebacteria bacterium]|nr:MAG: glycosyltransferase family 39 protein [Candidatus Woesebacteria bacterium]
MKKLSLLFLALIVILGSILRFYKLDQIPPSLNWDEVAAGYNAWTIVNWGADEYGAKFPLVFRSFGDDKHPVHIYLTALVYKAFGISDYNTRASSAAVGVLSIVAIYLLAKILFKSEVAGLFAALFMSTSPYAIHYSRGLWEANFAVFFFLAGCAIFYLGLTKAKWLVPFSFLFWGISIFAYQAAEIVVPPIVFLLCLIHVKEFLSNKKTLILSASIVLFFAGLVIMDPRILGFARINQTKFSEEVVNKYGGEVNIFLHNYKEYFTYSYLFQTGDVGPRASVKVIGEFYKIDLIMSTIGLLAILVKKRWETLFVLISWLLLSPIPGVVSSLTPHATRGIFIMGPILIFSAGGAAWVVELFRKNWLKVIVSVVIISFLSFEVKNYVVYYFGEYAKNEAIEWQYGMKQSALYIAEHPEYVEVFVDKIRQQPYIFSLYYLRVPLPLFLSTVRYDLSQSNSFNTVSFFYKYNFGNWDPIESYPSPGILYIITPSFYSGLRFKDYFDVKKLVKYPDGSDAFYLVAGHEKK